LNDPELDLAEILKELDDIGPLPSPDASLIQEQKKPKPEKNIIEIPPSTFKREVQTVRPIVPEVKRFYEGIIFYHKIVIYFIIIELHFSLGD